MKSEGDWLIVSEDGRFDTNTVGDDAPLSWIVSDQTFRPLPPEIFMRDYYEPRLLPRFLECSQSQKELASTCDRTFQHIRPLGQLDRLQPRIRIDSVLAGPTADTVRVRVTAVGAEDKSQPNGKTRTDAYDLRLFRDGQLVGRWPEVPDGGDELAAWRRRTHVPHGAHEFLVALPTQQSRQGGELHGLRLQRGPGEERHGARQLHGSARCEAAPAASLCGHHRSGCL